MNGLPCMVNDTLRSTTPKAVCWAAVRVHAGRNTVICFEEVTC